MLQRSLFIVLSALLLSGCAIGTTRLQVSHDALEPVQVKRHGTLQIRQFVDKRKENHEYIGNKRNGFGMVLGHVAPEEGVKLENLLTGYFAEALKEAGYKVVIEEPQSADKQHGEKFDAIIDGEILEFWLDLYMKVWQTIEIKTRAIQPVNRTVLWEETIKADQSNVLWVGATGEFEKVINEALTKALNQAAKDYASDRFQQAIQSGAP